MDCSKCDVKTKEIAGVICSPLFNFPIDVTLPVYILAHLLKHNAMLFLILTFHLNINGQIKFFVWITDNLYIYISIYRSMY